MTTVAADTIETINTDISLRTSSYQAALFSNDGTTSRVVLGDSNVNTYGITIPFTGAGLVDHADLAGTAVSFVGTASNLGVRHGYSNEPFWEVSGGAFHLKNVNANTGGEVGFIFRIGHNDELELVRKVVPPDGDPFYEEITKFGFTRNGETRIARDRGIVKYASVVGSPTQVDVALTTFLAYEPYTAYTALSPDPVTTSEILENPGHAFVATGVAPGADVPHAFSLVATLGGDAVAAGNSYWVSTIVKEDGPDGLATVKPRSFQVFT